MRRQSRPLNASRAESFERLLPLLSIPKDNLQENGLLDPATLFSFKPAEFWFEIGFGTGEHVHALMRRHPDHAFIGAEPYINGVAALLKALDADYENKPDNLRVHTDDALMVANSLKTASLDGIYILNPDPWHKKRHNKRRIVRPETLDIYARILKPGGKLVMSTDVPDMAEWMITHSIRHKDFIWTAQSAADWEKPPADWITTAYEVKGAKGAKKMAYLFFERKSL